MVQQLPRRLGGRCIDPRERPFAAFELADDPVGVAADTRDAHHQTPRRFTEGVAVKDSATELLG